MTARDPTSKCFTETDYHGPPNFAAFANGQNLPSTIMMLPNLRATTGLLYIVIEATKRKRKDVDRLAWATSQSRFKLHTGF